MSDSDDNVSLPLEESVIRRAIIQQIEKFGMDKLTSRVIRENLKQEFNKDFSEHKAAIDKITMDIIQNSSKPKKEEQSSDSDGSDSDDGVVFTDTAPKKKNKAARKRSASGSDSDLLEVGQKRRRAAPAPKKSAPRKKKVAEEGAPKPKRKTAYNVYCALSEELAALVGKKYMRRSDVVKTMWAYFRNNQLMDPKDKRYVLADELLMKIFKKRRFLGFGMLKDLSSHITEAKFLNEEERAALEKFEAEEEARRIEEAKTSENGGREGSNEEEDDEEKKDSGEENCENGTDECSD